MNQHAYDAYERILERHGDIEDKILSHFCKLYNAGEYAEAWGWANERRSYVERLWGDYPDKDIVQSAKMLMALCSELMIDARKTQVTGVLAS